MMRILHLSDLHFSHVTYSPMQFFSKRWIGNTNLVFFRKKVYTHSHLQELKEIIEHEKVDLILFTGDSSTTGRRDELEDASKFLQSLNIKVFSLPGNHDHYTRSDYRKRQFYDYFSNEKGSPFSLKHEGVEIHPLQDGWWLCLLDTVLATPIYSSQGLFSKELEERVKLALKEIPQDAKILFANHFPFFQFDSPRKILKRGMKLHDIFKSDPRVKLYLHGHTHRHCVADLRPDNLPIILDSGSVAHHKRGSFNLLNLNQSDLELKVFKLKEGSFSMVGDMYFSFEEAKSS